MLGVSSGPRSRASLWRLFRIRNKRHGYAIRRYEDLTGWKALAAGGPARRNLKGDVRETDRRARLTISRELGHGRVAIVRDYCG